MSDAVPVYPTFSRDLIVVGASAGGIEALLQLVRGLPSDLPAAVFVVVHLPPYHKSLLPELLSNAGPLLALHAEDGETIQTGRIYIAPPDRHLLVERNCVRLSSGARENFARPAVDVLFRSAASAYGPRVVGVVLSGSLSDGTAGLWEVKQHGGIAVVQTPHDAINPSMPQSAINRVPVDYVMPLARIPALLAELASERVTGMSEVAEEPLPTMHKEGDRVMVGAGNTPDEKPGEAAVNRDMAAQVNGERDGAVTVYVCPECQGTLWQVNAGQMTRFRCHVGHVYSGENLLEGYKENMERSLWHAIRTLRDKANLTRQLAHDARQFGNAEVAERYESKAILDEEHSASLERMLPSVTSANREE